MPSTTSQKSTVSTRDLYLLNEALESIAQARGLKQILSRIVGSASMIVEADAALLYLRDSKRERLLLVASKIPHPRAIGKLTLKIGEGITGWVAREKKAVALSSKAYLDPRFKPVPFLAEDRFEAFLSIPILTHGEAIGVLNLQHRAPYHHDRMKIELLEMLALEVAILIESAQALAEARQLSEALKERKLVGQATHILMEEFGLKEREAYQLMERQRSERGKTLREISEAVVLSKAIRGAPL